MPLRYLFAVGFIHMFPWMNDFFFHSSYLKEQNNVYPQTVEYIIFAALFIAAYYYSDAYIPPAEYNSKLNTEHYTTRGLVIGSTKKHYFRQLFYDIAVYCIPCIAVAVSVSFLRGVINFLLIFMTFYFFIYDNIVKKIWLKVCLVYIYVFICAPYLSNPLFYINSLLIMRMKPKLHFV